MKTFSIEELRTLVEKGTGLCTSIYMPTHRTGAESRQDPTRLKNLLREAEKHLVDRGLRTTQVREMLGPAESLVRDDLFWLHQSDSLAVFIAEGFFSYYRLPLVIDELSLTTDGYFHLKPLLPIFTNGQYYVLALSMKHVRLLQATRFSVTEVKLEDDVPLSLEEALKYDDPERQTQFHTPQPVGYRGAEQAAAFHGHGVGIDDRKPDIMRFFTLVDAGVRQRLKDEKAPLILACVDYLYPLYAKVNDYPGLLERWVPGNPDGIGTPELQKRSWPLVETHFQQARQWAMERYWDLAGTGRTSTDLAEIVIAAHGGRIDELFVALEVERWGTYDPDTASVEVHGEAMPVHRDLLDLAAIQTILHNGSVYAVSGAGMPDKSDMVAIFRY